MDRFRVFSSLAFLWISFAVSGMPATATTPDRPSAVRSTPAVSSDTVGSPEACSVDTRDTTRLLTGRVVSEDGSPLAGARIITECGTFRHSATTRQDGSFSLPVPPGTYRVQASRQGFDTLARIVDVVADDATRLELVLTPPTFEDAMTVTASAAGYEASGETTATKTATPLLETPQAVTVVTHRQIEDTGAQGLQEALNYAVGVRSDAYGLDSRTDSMLVRGSSPDNYLDGLRQNFNWYTSTTRTDPYMLERVEVLRGPSSMLYGQGGTAGIVNMISKRPRAAREREIVLQTGSFDRMQVQADWTGPLTEDGRWLYRVVALGRDAETQVDHVRDDRALVAPSLTWRPNDDTSLTLQARWQQDRSGSTLQFFPWSGSGAPNPNGRIPTETFIGETGFDRYDSERLTAGWLFERRLGTHWTVRQNLRLTHNEVDYRTFYTDAFSSPGDSFLDEEQRIIGRYAEISRPEVDMWTADQHAEGSFVTGPVRHQLLVGLDALHFRQNERFVYDEPQHLGGGVPPIDVYDPVYTGYTAGPLAEAPESTQSQAGLYVQDQMKVGPHWIVLAGLRHDRAESGLEGAEDEETDATTGRLGLMYAAAGGWSPYVSYSESFTPVSGTDFHHRRYDPLRGEQVEAGIKFQPPSRGFTVTAAAFELREENRLVNDPENPLNQIQAGSTETSGLELEVLGSLTDIVDLSAHYNYLDNDAELTAAPEHQAAVWARRSFSLGGLGSFTAGLGVRYFDAFRDGIAPTVPELTLYDAMLQWNPGPWSLTLNASNLEDEPYVSTCLPRGDCFYGARRTVSLSVAYQL